jgi:O-antigen/teichoic acid export membrane protein
MSSSAPVLAISSQAGAAAVPVFTVPSTLLNIFLGVFSSFNANLQAAYGEAAGRGDAAWISQTLRGTLRHMLLVVGLLAAGFMMLAAPVITLWTQGRLTVSPVMVVSVMLICLCASFMSVFQFVLSGLNRHRVIAAAEIANGVLCLVFAAAIVRLLGAQWIGLAIMGAAFLTNARVATREVKSCLDGEPVWPSFRFLVAIAAATSLACVGGWLWLRAGEALFDIGGGDSWPLLLSAVPVMTLLYLGAVRWLLPVEASQVLKRFVRLVPFLSSRFDSSKS